MSAAHLEGMNQNRTPAGVPTGGQFAEQAKGEADVALVRQHTQDNDLTAFSDEYQRDTVLNLNVGSEVVIDGSTIRAESPTTYRVIAPDGVTAATNGVVLGDHEQAVLQAKAYAALGPGTPLSAEQEGTLRQLLATESAENPWGDDEVIEELGELGEGEGLYGAERIAGRIQEALHTEGDRSFSFGFDANSEGEISSYSVGVYASGHGVYIAQNSDVKYLNPDRDGYGFDGQEYYHFGPEGERIPGKPPEKTGLRKAIAIAEVLKTDYAQVRTKVEAMGARRT